MKNSLDFVIPERLLLVDKISLKDLPAMVERIDLDEMKRHYLQEATRLATLRRGS